MSLLREHQRTGATWLAAHPRSLLGDVPRLGKTRTILAALRERGCQQPLVVCPATVRTHWAREAEALGWATLAFPSGRIWSYDEIVRGGVALMANLMPNVDALVLDESHYAKHAESSRTRLLLGRDGYARRVETVFLASATPMPKNPRELFTQLCYLRPDVLRAFGVTTREKWDAAFCEVKGRFVRGQWRESPVNGVTRNLDTLKLLLNEVMLRRTKADVGIDVPDVDVQVTRLDTDAETQQEFGHGGDYAPVARRVIAGEQLEDIANDPHVARMRRRLGELKAPLVVEMLRGELAESDEKVVVFAHHREVINRIAGELFDAFGGASGAIIHGDTSPAARQCYIDWFQNDPKFRWIVCQTHTCKEGIALHAADRAINVEPDWTGAVNVQAAHRVVDYDRPGRKTVYEMVALAGTLDEAIVRQNQRETLMAAETFGRE